MIALSRNVDGRVIRRFPDRAVMALVQKYGARVHPSLIEGGWVDRNDLEALGWVEVEPFNPVPGEKVFVPSRTGWALVEVD